MAKINYSAAEVDERLDLIEKLTYDFDNAGIATLDALKAKLIEYVNAMPTYSSRFCMIRITGTFSKFYGNGSLYYFMLIKGGNSSTFPAFIIKHSGSSSSTYPRLMYMALTSGTTWTDPITIVN